MQYEFEARFSSKARDVNSLIVWLTKHRPCITLMDTIMSKCDLWWTIKHILEMFPNLLSFEHFVKYASSTRGITHSQVILKTVFDSMNLNPNTFMDQVDNAPLFLTTPYRFKLCHITPRMSREAWMTLICKGMNINIHHPTGINLLMFAVHTFNVTLLKILLEYKVNLPVNPDPIHALRCTCTRGNESTLMYMAHKVGVEYTSVNHVNIDISDNITMFSGNILISKRKHTRESIEQLHIYTLEWDDSIPIHDKVYNFQQRFKRLIPEQTDVALVMRSFDDIRLHPGISVYMTCFKLLSLAYIINHPMLMWILPHINISTSNLVEFLKSDQFSLNVVRSNHVHVITAIRNRVEAGESIQMFSYLLFSMENPWNSKIFLHAICPIVTDVNTTIFNPRTKRPMTLLYYTVLAGDVNMVRLLLTRGAIVCFSKTDQFIDISTVCSQILFEEDAFTISHLLYDAL